MTYRILSLDGGGVWALIQAKALAKMYPGLTGHQVLAGFDAAAGNSAGSIVLGALIADMPVERIVALFMDPATRGKLFVPVTGMESIGASCGIGPKWSSEGKLFGLLDILGSLGTTMVSALPVKTKILIPSFSVDTNRAVLFRSYKPALACRLVDTTLALAIHASSSAPVSYFDAPALINGAQYWDGGIAGYNNPVLAAVTDAWAAGERSIAALSLGTAAHWRPSVSQRRGAEDIRLFEPRVTLGEISAIRCLAMAVIGDPPEAACADAHVITGGGVVRMNPSAQVIQAGGAWSLPPGFAAMNPADPAQALVDLLALDMDAVEPAAIAKIAALADAWLDDSIPNEGVRTDPETGLRIDGQPTFSAALNVWRSM